MARVDEDLESRIQVAFEEWTRQRHRYVNDQATTIRQLATEIRRPARTWGESARYTAERVVATLLALWLARGLLGW